ncbi:MAG TPA: EamA family transporter [Phycisphaerales bacterium]|nr:EamA family transporter [Phycisphaerales bacterium]
MTKAILFAVLAGLCWGVGEIGTKAALNTRQVGPMTAVFVRALVTVLPTLIAYLVATQVWKSEPARWYEDASGRTWAYLIVGSGLLAGFAGVFFFYMGLGSKGGDISLLRPIAFGIAPATAVFLGWWWLGEALTVKKLIAVVLIVTGIVLLAGGSHGSAPAQPGSGERAG